MAALGASVYVYRDIRAQLQDAIALGQSNTLAAIVRGDANTALATARADRLEADNKALSAQLMHDVFPVLHDVVRVVTGVNIELQRRGSK